LELFILGFEKDSLKKVSFSGFTPSANL